MRDEEILIWYEDLETATCNTDSPEAGIISHVRDLISKQEERIRQRDGEWVDAIEDTLHFGIIPETLAGAVECMKAWLEEREERIRALEAQLNERPKVTGASPVCLDCNHAGIRNCSHFDNCAGVWVYKPNTDLQSRIERVKRRR